jgi:sarcosine oxidase subunit gamma
MLDVTTLPCGTQYVFRGAPAMAQLASAAFGLTLPEAACRAEKSAARAALWLGPDEWLLVADGSEAEAIEAAFAAAFEGQPASFVDVSHRTLFFQLSGPQAARTLNGGCPLDLDMSVFPVGMCTRTVLEKAEIILWRTGPDEFQVGVWRSFAAYVRGLLEEGGRSLA